MYHRILVITKMQSVINCTRVIDDDEAVIPSGEGSNPAFIGWEELAVEPLNLGISYALNCLVFPATDGQTICGEGGVQRLTCCSMLQYTRLQGYWYSNCEPSGFLRHRRSPVFRQQNSTIWQRQ